MDRLSAYELAATSDLRPSEARDAEHAGLG